MDKNIDIQLHLKLFAETFVLESRRAKWIELLCNRPDNILSQSAKLFNYLDHNLIEQNDTLEGVVADNTLGVFYNFREDPSLLSFKDARNTGQGHDALFSVVAGKKALYFSSEGWNFICSK